MKTISKLCTSNWAYEYTVQIKAVVKGLTEPKPTV